MDSFSSQLFGIIITTPKLSRDKRGILSVGIPLFFSKTLFLVNIVDFLRNISENEDAKE